MFNFCVYRRTIWIFTKRINRGMNANPKVGRKRQVHIFILFDFLHGIPVMLEKWKKKNKRRNPLSYRNGNGNVKKLYLEWHCMEFHWIQSTSNGIWCVDEWVWARDQTTKLLHSLCAFVIRCSANLCACLFVWLGEWKSAWVSLERVKCNPNENKWESKKRKKKIKSAKTIEKQTKRKKTKVDDD